MQISKTCSVIPWSHVEEFGMGRIVKVPTFAESWSQDVFGVYLFVYEYIEAAAPAVDAERLNTGEV